MNIIDDWLEKNGDKEIKKQVKLILSDVSQQHELLAFKDWFNKLPEDSDDRLYLTDDTINRFRFNCG
jgi:hypothetical protein